MKKIKKVLALVQMCIRDSSKETTYNRVVPLLNASVNKLRSIICVWSICKTVTSAYCYREALLPLLVHFIIMRKFASKMCIRDRKKAFQGDVCEMAELFDLLRGNCLPVLINTSSFAFQIAGAVLLLLWSIRKRDTKIKEQCLESAGILSFQFDETGAVSYTHLDVYKRQM